MAFHLGQIKIGAGVLAQRRLGIVEKIQAEIKQRAGHDLAVNPHMVFRQVPAARPHDEHRRPLAQNIMLA